jgi:leader peptidase (prepilin peptidase)/N-methyltransferase
LDFTVPFVIVTVFIGLIFGSFATALIHRVPAGISWSYSRRGRKDGREPAVARSACPHCNTTLQVLDLVPVFSWLFLGGKCRYCKAPISIKYPATEVATALACIGVFTGCGFTPQSLVIMLAMPFLIALAVIDLKLFLLPDSLNAALGLLWPVYLMAGILEGRSWPASGLLVLNGMGSACLYTALSFGLGWIMKKVLKKEALGFGDVKFFAVAGLWLGIAWLPYFLILAGILGVILGIGYRIVIKSAYFPFGPALIASFYILLVFGKHGAFF